MSIWKPFRTAYIKTTNLTHGYQGKDDATIKIFYKLWANVYDKSIKLDPGYQRELNHMIESVVRRGDVTADLGCGTGLSSFHAASIADKVVSIDPSTDMTPKLKVKLKKNNIRNIEIRNGFFPGVLKSNERFDSIISSFMFAHLTHDQRLKILDEIFNNLNNGGRIGLFSAQGEIASSFETRDEIQQNLVRSGFQNIRIDDVSDIYRISTAIKALS